MKYLPVRYLLLGLTAVIALYFAMIPVKLREVRSRIPEPQAIFVLGGGSDREVAAARLAMQYPELDVWVSSGSNSEAVTETFKGEGVALHRLHLDYRASDTVTNFTTMAELFHRRKIEHVYLLTSDFHMRRARAIAFFVFGSRGIVCTPIAAPSNGQMESDIRILRDVVRAITWLFTRTTGAGLTSSFF